MKQKTSYNLVNFLISTEGETEEQIKEYLEAAGIDPNDAIKKALEDIKERRAERKRTEGKKLQEKFDKTNRTVDKEMTEAENILIENLAIQFREGEQIREDEKIAIVERDRKKLERFRRENKKGDEE